MKKAVGIIACCVVVGGLAAIGIYSRMGKEALSVSAQPTEILVAAQNPTRGDLSKTSSFIGTIQPDESVQVFPKTSGTVLKTYFEVGDTVQKGDLLYEFDPELAQLQYNAAKIAADTQLGSGYDGTILQAQAALQQAQIAYNSARTSLRNYNNDTDDELIRIDKLITQTETAIKATEDEIAKAEAALEAGDGHVTQDDIDKLKAELKQHETNLSMYNADYRDAEDDDDPQLQSLRTAYKNAQIAYNSAKETYDLVAGISREDAEKVSDANLQIQAKQLEYTKVYSPISGVIEQKNVSDNNLSSTGAVAYVISNKNAMTVQFSVSESVIANLETGDQIQIENAGQTMPGTILEISTAVDQSSGLFRVKASVDAENALLHTGTTVKLYVTTAKAQNSIMLPLDCLYYDAEQPYVYLYQDGKAVKTEVTTGITGEDQVEIVSGLTDADQVITTWHPRLTDGAQVTVQPAGGAASQPDNAQDASDAPSQP